METTLVHDYFKSFRSETHILLVDDDMIYLDLLAGVLEYCSYKVTTAKSGQDALSLLSNGYGKFDLVLIDAGLIYANSSFLFREPVINKVPFICMGSDNEYSAMEIIRNGAYFYMKKPISLENIRSLWGHATAAKFPKSNVKDNGKQVLRSNLQGKNETVNYDNTKAAIGNKIIDRTVAGTNESTSNQSWKVPFTSNSYQFGHEGCNTSKDLETTNNEHGHVMQVVSLVQGPICGSMPLDILQQLPSQENERALVAYQNPLAENQADNDDQLDAYQENIFLSDGIFETSSENIVLPPPKNGMIDTAMFNEGIENITIKMIPNSNEPINNQLPPVTKD